MGLIPDLARPHVPWSNEACAPQLLKPRLPKARTLQQEKPLLKPRLPKARTLQQEQPLQGEAWALQMEINPDSPQLEKSLHSNKDPTQPINKIIY